MGRYVANVIVGVLEAHSPGEQLLLHYAAPYMMKAAASLSTERICLLPHPSTSVSVGPVRIRTPCILYPKMEHVTCGTHTLHQIAEEVRANFPEVDKLFGRAQVLLADKEIAGKLSHININFGLIPDAITSLEKSQATPLEHLQIVDEVVDDLSRACGKVGDVVSMKMKKCITKNRG
ncbi:hypothetical protein C0J52_14820 [Blattella germanica]|nr:hypothetical protein C0J52_14820 [Blattella germanica]